jgi:hypothetical protein
MDERLLRVPRCLIISRQIFLSTGADFDGAAYMCHPLQIGGSGI